MTIINRSFGNLLTSQEQVFQLDEATTRDAKAVLRALGADPQRYGLDMGEIFLSLAAERKTFDPGRIMLTLHGQILSLAGTFIGSSLITMCTAFAVVYAGKKGWDIAKTAWGALKKLMPSDDAAKDAGIAQDFSVEGMDTVMNVVLPGIWPMLASEAEGAILRTSGTFVGAATPSSSPAISDPNPAQAIVNSLQALTDEQVSVLYDAGIFDDEMMASLANLRDQA